MCDRWDIGGLSTAWHWQTDSATIFIYDGYPGGIGLTRRGYDAFDELAADAALLIAECPCESRLPQLRAEPQVRQPERAAAQAGSARAPAGRHGPRLGSKGSDMTTPAAPTAASIAPLDAARLDAVEPLWRTLIDHLREMGSVVELVPHEQLLAAPARRSTRRCSATARRSPSAPGAANA